MTDSIVKGDWWFRVQIDVPQDGRMGEDLDKEENLDRSKFLAVQICHRQGLYIASPDGTPDYAQLVGVVPGNKILDIPTVNKLKDKYPKIVESLKYLQYVAIEEGLLALNPPSSESEPAPTPSPTPTLSPE